MPKYISWDQTNQGKGGSGGKGGSSSFLKLQAGNKYKIRLVGRPLAYWQHWEPVICRSPYIDEKTNKILCPLMNMGYEPKLRYAIWVFDRDDGNKLKVMDFPASLKDQFGEWKANFNEDPGGQSGPDWVVKLDSPGDKKRTKYKGSYLDKAPFTKEEADQIAEGNLGAKLAELRRDNTPEEITKMLQDAGISGGAKPAAKAEAAPPAVVQKQSAPAAASSDGGDDSDPLNF